MLNAAGVKRLHLAIITEAVWKWNAGDDEAARWLFLDADAELSFTCAGLSREKFLYELRRIGRKQRDSCIGQSPETKNPDL
jgi:hypothetical protein